MSERFSSPTSRLMTGLAVTLAVVGVFSWYALHQIAGLQDLQTQLIDRNRRDTLQLLRIQNDLYSLGLAMRDMVNGDEPYGLLAYRVQFSQKRADLEDALRLEKELAPVERSPDRQAYFARSLAQFWTSVDLMFSLAAGGKDAQARNLIRTSLEPQQSSITTTVARLLVENNESEKRATARIQSIYAGVQRNVYYFLGAALVAILLTSLYLIRSNRQLFERLGRLSAQRSDLARKLITMQEEVLRSISRELHDEFGQILTAIGAMLTRAAKQDVSPSFRESLQEVREITQSTLEKTRSLYQSLHPAILDDGGLEQALAWYIPVFEKQTGIKVQYQKSGASPEVADGVAIHVYRVVQEALNNAAKHSKSSRAWVRVDFSPERLHLEVEDRGVGLPADQRAAVRRGIGMVAMRERAELLRGKIEFIRPTEGGTLVRLDVPLTPAGAE
ncbi:MAG: integral rane sensor signal transduction histidine kinase [Bryobacterales bacterium]|nr:integral rane sensor signal transduction histidine kinase [Bryobacterales bacterium]